MVNLPELTDTFEAHDCQHCGLPILLAPSKLRKAPFCTDKCRIAHLRGTRKAVQVSVTRQCVTCGDDLVGGRSDRRFCSDACRQKAHRTRRTVQGEALPLLDDNTGAGKQGWFAVNRLANGLDGYAIAVRTLEGLSRNYQPGKGQMRADALLKSLDHSLMEMGRLRNTVAEFVRAQEA